MRYLFDIGHPKDIHTFKHVYKTLENRGHDCLMVCRDRQHNIDLMRSLTMDYVCQGRHYKSLPGKLYGLIKNEIGLVRISLDFKPDVFISHNSTMAAHVSTLLCKPHIAIEDTFNKEQTILSVPFTNVVLTGDYSHPSLGKKELQYPGYHELAYLHPNVFIPDINVLHSLGVSLEERYAVIRFVAWNATHDVGHKGVSIDNKIKLVGILSSEMKVFISSENDLPQELKSYQIQIDPKDMHSVLGLSYMFVGESSTMAAESAVLGTFGLYINNSQLGYIKDLANYGLIDSYTESPEDQRRMVQRAGQLARTLGLKNETDALRKEMLKRKIDVSAFMVWFVENYPNSEWEMRKGNFNFDRFK